MTDLYIDRFIVGEYRIRIPGAPQAVRPSPGPPHLYDLQGRGCNMLLRPMHCMQPQDSLTYSPSYSHPPEQPLSSLSMSL